MGLSIATLAVAVPLVVVSGLVLFVVLRFLQKRLRIFTRGTIAFMTFVAVVFTLVDLVNLAQEVKFRDHHLRQAAVERLVGETAHRVLVPEELTARVKHDGPGLERDIVRVREQLAESIEDLDLCCDADRLHLACYDVRYASNGLRRWFHEMRMACTRCECANAMWSGVQPAPCMHYNTG